MLLYAIASFLRCECWSNDGATLFYIFSSGMNCTLVSSCRFISFFLTIFLSILGFSMEKNCFVDGYSSESILYVSCVICLCAIETIEWSRREI